MNKTVTPCYVLKEDLNKWRDIASGHPRRHFSIWEGNFFVCNIGGTTVKNKGQICSFPSSSREGIKEHMTRFGQHMPPSLNLEGVVPRLRRVYKLCIGMVVIRIQRQRCVVLLPHPSYGEHTLRRSSNKSYPWIAPSF